MSMATHQAEGNGKQNDELLKLKRHCTDSDDDEEEELEDETWDDWKTMLQRRIAQTLRCYASSATRLTARAVRHSSTAHRRTCLIFMKSGKLTTWISTSVLSSSITLGLR